MPNDGGPFDTGNPAGFVKQLIQQGYNATQGLGEFRAAGGRIRDSRWFSLYGQVDDTIRRTPETLALDPNQLPGPNDYGVWAMGRGNQYATQVSVTILDRDTGLMTTRQHTYITDLPHTPAEAEADAIDMFGDPDTESAYGETVMGATAVHVWQTVPYASQ